MLIEEMPVSEGDLGRLKARRDRLECELSAVRSLLHFMAWRHGEQQLIAESLERWTLATGEVPQHNQEGARQMLQAMDAEDQRDVVELVPLLGHDDQAERVAAAEAILEIVKDAPARVIPLPCDLHAVPEDGVAVVLQEGDAQPEVESVHQLEEEEEFTEEDLAEGEGQTFAEAGPECGGRLTIPRNKLAGDQWKYVAQDCDGSWYAFSAVPLRVGGGWDAPEGQEYHRLPNKVFEGWADDYERYFSIDWGEPEQVKIEPDESEQLTARSGEPAFNLKSNNGQYQLRVYRHLQENGPQRVSKIGRECGIPQGSLHAVLRHEAFEKKEDLGRGYWGLA